MSKNEIAPAVPQEPTSHIEVSRREFLKTGAAMGGLSAVAPTTLAAALAPDDRKTKPNIVFIISDQINIDTVAYFASHFRHPAYGPHWVKTPNLDRLAREGTSFMESHSANPVCCPSRSCMFTGRMAIETGVVTNNIGIDKNLPNMGQWLEQHSDYRRIYCGKWHAGGAWNYPSVDGPRKVPGFDVIPVGGSGAGIHVDSQVSNSVSSFMANDAGLSPYLIVASLMNPHDCCFWFMEGDGEAVTAEKDVFNLGEDLPILPPNFVFDFKEPPGLAPYKAFRTDTQWRNYTYDYYRMVEDIDEHVGRIMEAVRDRNDDTVVVFIGDHGDGLGRHHRPSKWHPYESSLKVPLIVWNPKRIRAGVLDTDHMTSGVDIMPTVCSYAGIEPPPLMRGMSLRPVMEQSVTPAPRWRDEIYAEWQVTGRLIRTKKYKYIMKYVYSGNFEQPFVRKDSNAHTQFVPGHGEDYAEYPEALLFDMENDPWETTNLIDDPKHAETIRQHRKLLRIWEAKLLPGQHFDRN